MKTYVLKPFDEKNAMPVLPTTRKQTLIDAIKNLEVKLKANINNPKLSHEQRLQLHDHYISVFKSLWSQLNPNAPATHISGEPIAPRAESDSDDDEDLQADLVRNLLHIMKTEKKRQQETPKAPRKHVKKLKFSPFTPESPFEPGSNPFRQFRESAEKEKLLKSLEVEPQREPVRSLPKLLAPARKTKPPPPPTLATTRERRPAKQTVFFPAREGRGISKTSFRIRLYK